VDIGRVCVKTAGREAGKKCVVVDVIDETYVLVSGPEVRRRRCNIKHLEPLEMKLDIGRDAPDEEVARALETAERAGEGKRGGAVETQEPAMEGPRKEEPEERASEEPAEKGPEG